MFPHQNHGREEEQRHCHRMSGGELAAFDPLARRGPKVYEEQESGERGEFTQAAGQARPRIYRDAGCAMSLRMQNVVRRARCRLRRRASPRRRASAAMAAEPAAFTESKVL